VDLATEQYRIHPGWWTAVLVGVVAAGIWLCSAIFVGTFTSYVPVTLTSDRAGLVMEPGAPVRMRGVPVGRVDRIEAGPGPVRLQLDLFPDEVANIPANAQARIRATTAFGAKFVDLVDPENPSAQHISAGTVLRSENVTTEVNTVFQSLVDVLHQVDPPKLNATMSAFADAVRGQGRTIGRATTAANNVLGALNPRMDTAADDWRSLASASEAYAAAAPALLATLDAAGVTSATLTSHASDLDTLLLNTIGFAQSGIDLVAPNRDNLVNAVNVLAPTTDLLWKYNPEYTCLLLGAKWTLDNGAYQAAGGDGRTIMIDDAFLFGDDPYRYPDNLPIVAAKGGPGGKPGCGSLPDASKDWPIRQLVTNTGWGTGLDIRPNPGIGQPWWADFLPVTRALPQAPSIRGEGPPARGPMPPYPGAPPYGAPQYGPDGTPLYPPAPGAPPQP
jgi:phospholipid/cholesterol/gamma-HCH transport system substrate-binding protein